MSWWSWLSWHPFEGVFVREGRWVVRYEGYRFHRAFFLATVVVLCVSVALVFLLSGGGVHYGWSCPAGSYAPCENPFLDAVGGCRVSDPVVCSPVTLLPGASVGERTPWLVENFQTLALFLVFLAFVANHLVMNKGWVWS